MIFLFCRFLNLPHKDQWHWYYWYVRQGIGFFGFLGKPNPSKNNLGAFDLFFFFFFHAKLCHSPS